MSDQESREKTQEVVEEPKAQDADGAERKDDSETFDREYVEGLRKEAAAWRKKVRELETALKDKEAAEARLAELEQEKARYEAMLERKERESSVYIAAARLGFYDPSDAVRLLDLDSVEDVDAAVSELAKAKPHLVKPRGNDAGARGGGEAVDMNMLIRKKAGVM